MSGTTSGVAFSSSGGDVNMLIFQGKTLNFNVVFGGESPVDITGWTVTLQARDKRGVVILELSTGAAGGVTLGGANGTMMFAMAAADTAEIRSSGVYEIEATTAGGDVYRVMSGAFGVIGEVVR
jgi:hypothetical protein